MKIPFWHRTAIGLEVTPTAIHAVELLRSPLHTWVQCYLYEPLGAGSPGEALRRMAAKLQPAGKYLVIGLDPVLTWHFFLPPMEDLPPADASELNREQLRRHLGPVIDEPDLCVRWLNLEPRGSVPSWMVVITQKDHVEAQKNLCHAAGLSPNVVGCLLTALGHCFAFDPDFTAGHARLQWGTEEMGWRLRYHKGVLKGIDEVDPFDPTLVQGITCLDPDPSQEVRPLSQLSDHLVLPSEAAPAAGLALAALFPELPAVNMLSTTEVARAHDQVERYAAVRLTLVLGALLLTALAGSRLYEQHLDRRLAAWENTAARHAPTLASLQHLRREITREQTRLQQGVGLQLSTLNVAGALERVGEGMPEDTWLHRLSWKAGADGLDLTMEGETTRDTGAPDLIENLEALHPGRQVHLVRFERMGEHRRFEVNLSLPAHPIAGES